MKRAVSLVAILPIVLSALTIGRGGSSAVSLEEPLIAIDVSAIDGIQSSATYPAFTSDVAVDLVIQTNVPTGAFEVDVLFDLMSMRFLGWEEGPFLSSTGRLTDCLEIVHDQDIRLGCASSGPSPAGAQGEGVLATLHFRPLAIGESCL